MDYLWLVLIFLTGICLGSFLNVCICRVPKGESIISPPSHCPKCLKTLGVLDLVPLLGYLVLGGKCRYCKSKISWQYPIVELLMGILLVLIIVKYDITVEALKYSVFFSLLVVASVIDLELKIIPDKVNIAGLVMAVPFLFQSKDIFLSGLLGFLIGGLLLLLIAVVSRGGMGGGDIKLAAVIGLYLGWKLMLVALFIAFVLGALIGGLLLLTKRKKMGEAVPFGPYLATGSIVGALMGEEMITWYLMLL